LDQRRICCTHVDYELLPIEDLGHCWGPLTSIMKFLLNDSEPAEHALLDGTADEQTLARFESEQSQRAEYCVRKQDAYAAALDELSGVLEMLDASPGDARLLLQ